MKHKTKSLLYTTSTAILQAYSTTSVGSVFTSQRKEAEQNFGKTIVSKMDDTTNPSEPQRILWKQHKNVLLPLRTLYASRSFPCDVRTAEARLGWRQDKNQTENGDCHCGEKTNNSGRWHLKIPLRREAWMTNKNQFPEVLANGTEFHGACAHSTIPTTQNTDPTAEPQRFEPLEGEF